MGRIEGAYIYGTFVSGRMSGQLCVNARVYPADDTIMAILLHFHFSFLQVAVIEGVTIAEHALSKIRSRPTF